MWGEEVEEVDRMQVVTEVRKKKWEELPRPGNQVDRIWIQGPVYHLHPLSTGNSMISESLVSYLQKVGRKPRLSPSWGW